MDLCLPLESWTHPQIKPCSCFFAPTFYYRSMVRNVSCTLAHLSCYSVPGTIKLILATDFPATFQSRLNLSQGRNSLPPGNVLFVYLLCIPLLHPPRLLLYFVSIQMPAAHNGLAWVSICSGCSESFSFLTP